MNRIQSNFAVPVPYGAQVLDKGVQFTIFSRHARRVWLMLFDGPADAQPTVEFELTPANNRIGDLWHIFIADARPGQFYLYRMEAPDTGPNTKFFDPKQWLLDPCALAVSGTTTFGEKSDGLSGPAPLNGAAFPKGVIIDDDFDWGDDQLPHIPMSETVFYETHVRGFTKHPSSGVEHPGTYRGLIEKIPYLQDLGVTAVELLPIHEFNEVEYLHGNDARSQLRNFWGYSTMSFFAPNARYAHAGVHGQQVTEFKEMVKAFHKAGIEIILDVVYNHTSEGGPSGPTCSFRGIDNSIYYMTNDKGEYHNFTGCGNTVNCNHPVVRDLILNSLRYWHLKMRVDGFRFDLASVMSRAGNGDVLPNPPVIEHIAEDPSLRDAKLVAEAWDAVGLYQVGSFPNPHWSEWNGRYRDNIRAFWRGDRHMLRSLATGLVASPDLYRRPGQTPLKTVNFIACHDGFTLRDIVSYNDKHNEANHENNRDGENHNRSSNYGVEGPTDDAKILRIRKRQQKNLLATVLLSQGVPMLLAGDEFSRSQKGSNNAYCQDNEISWVDWAELDKHGDLHDFVRQLIAFRKAHPSLRLTRFLNDRHQDEAPADIQWFGPSGKPVDWDNGKAIGLLLDPVPQENAPRDNALVLLFNASESKLSFRLPDYPGHSWKRALSTEKHGPYYHSILRSVRTDARSVNVLVSKYTAHGHRTKQE